MTTQATLPLPSPAHQDYAQALPAGHSSPSHADRVLVEAHFTGRGSGIEAQMEFRWFGRQLPSCARRVADLGCGAGALFPTIGPERVIGIDHLPGGLAITRRRFAEVPLLCADVHDLPVCDASLDAITCQHLIEHLAQPDSAVANWHRKLVTGGMLLIATPNRSFVDPTVYDDPTHVHIFDGAGLARLLCAAGFRIMDIRSLGLPLFRAYHGLPGGWRVRRFVVRNATLLSRLPYAKWRGQTLVCAAMKRDTP